MTPPSLPVPGWVLLAGGAALAAVGLPLLIARTVRRSVRRRSREREVELVRAIGAFLSTRQHSGPVRIAAEQVTEAEFWTAVESVAFRLDREPWLKLSRVLRRVPWLATERRALRDDSPWRRELAAKRLALILSPRSRRALRAALKRGPEPVSFQAALALARFRDVGALNWILRNPRALQSRRTKAWDALLRAFGRAVLPRLAKRLEKNNVIPPIERAIVETLGQGGYRKAIGAIEARLKSPDLEVRIAAARAIGRLGAVEAASALLSALEDEHWQVRAQAAWGLGRTRAPVASQALTKLLTDKSWWVRHHAAYALGELGPEGMAELREAAERSPDRYAREIASEVLEGGFKVQSA